MARKVLILNGPNLNLLGQRELGIYGANSMDDIADDCGSLGAEISLDVDFRQSNHEGVLIDWLHEAHDTAEGVVFNPAAYGHRSIALHDAIRSIDCPVVELHLSNIHAREPFRHTTMTASVSAGVICGFGPSGYLLALRALAEIIENKDNS